jgi:peptidyl-dipeptidase Dcp
MVVLTIVSNNSNFIKERIIAVLIFTDATTLFHEFGHALHGLCSNVTYPTLPVLPLLGIMWNFLLKFWRFETPEVLNKFALHYKPMSQFRWLVERIDKASTNEGFSTVETIANRYETAFGR